MRLYLSYAQNDAPYCMELVECLHGAHEIWYDERQASDGDWRQGARQRLAWADAFLYILSSESLASRYCQDEYRMAQEAGRLILPLRIEADLQLPAEFASGPILDLSGGLDAAGQRNLLNALLLAERQLSDGRALTSAVNGENPQALQPAGNQPLLALGQQTGEAQGAALEAALEAGIKALNRGEYENALYLLRQVAASGPAQPYVELPALLAQAEGGAQEERQRRQAERLYPPIRELVRSSASHALGCQAFSAFQRDFPHYDPDNLAAACAPAPLAGLLWRQIPAGETVIQHEERRIRYWNEAFRISQYPITNAQFQAFVDAADGYAAERWWQSSEGARAWRQAQPQPAPARFPYPEHPRENISWFEAQAFCAWLSELLQMEARLPSEQQWQQAARGDDERPYPWGQHYQSRRCNAAEAGRRQTAAVAAHPAGASPFGVEDLLGNVWEWCENEARPRAEDALADQPIRRIVRGGSFLSSAERLTIDTYQTLTPGARAATVGFRIVAPAI